MTVIFQLFCVDDLKMLGEEGRAELLKIIGEALRETGNKKPGEASRICLEASNNFELQPAELPQQARAQVEDAIGRRVDVVSQQLKSPLPSSPSDSPKIPLSQRITGYSGPEGLREEEEKKIREWAASCEVNYFNFYYPLLLIKERAYRMFSQRTGQQRPKGPDSPYSPLNTHHPLYDLFSNLKVDPNPTQGAAEPSP